MLNLRRSVNYRALPLATGNTSTFVLVLQKIRVAQNAPVLHCRQCLLSV